MASIAAMLALKHKADKRPIMGRQMKQLLFAGVAVALGLAFGAHAEDLSAANAVAEMAPGVNFGNTLEAIGQGHQPFASSQETAWGNPAANQAVFDAYKAAGFKSVRIPVAWNQYAKADGTIDAKWMARVTQVVDYARKAGLYVVINVHWDGGWMQPTRADQAAVDAKLATFWTQIANNFKDYDDHLLFAGTNEVMVTNVYSEPTGENCAAQNSFTQTFVDAVRATGGNNATRFLVVQAYNTNINWALSCNARLPTDPTPDRLMMEVHYYDPYDFTLNDGSKVWQWGKIAKDPSATQSWANESYADGQFQKMKKTFVDKGIPVILGEYGAYGKPSHHDDTYRLYWDQYITHSAYNHGMVPMYWDTGGLIDRKTGAVKDTAGVSTLINAAK